MDAGKAVAEKTRLAREAQKKVANEYEASKKTPASQNVAKEATTPPEESKPPTLIGLNTNQLIAVVGIVVLLLGLYYKHDELKPPLLHEDHTHCSLPFCHKKIKHLLRARRSRQRYLVLRSIHCCL